jgi:hypothetical protein
MSRALLPLLLLTTLLLPACTDIGPPERFPGFESAAPDSLATIRESDFVFLKAVDGNRLDRRSPIFSASYTYLQFQLPAGTHQLTIYYECGELSSFDVTLPATLQPGHTYSFKSNPDKFHMSFATLTTSQWHPALIEDTPNQPASTPPTTTPAAAD